jgi:uncharacterized membrane protein
MSLSSIDSQAVVVHRASRLMWAALILSLSINLLIAGIVIGSIWAVRKGGYWQAPVAFERSQRFMGGLSSERRREIRTIFFEHRPGLVPYWQAVREARRRIGRMIESGTYSENDLKSAMDELFRKEMEARQAAKPMISAMLAKLKPDERLHFIRVFLPYLDNPQELPTERKTE